MAHIESWWVNGFRRLPDSPCEDLLVSFVFVFVLVLVCVANMMGG